MTTFEPRPPYAQKELERLYPKGIQLQLVQILLRHGERNPVSTRFENAGLPPYWPYCNAARRLSSTIMTNTDWSSWDELRWRRRLETFGDDDGPVIASGPGGEIDAVCNLGELTDKGRETTLALGERLRHLYVDQLGFMPRLISDADMFYLRATPMPRALESVQQSFWGMYPLTARTGNFPPPTIITRTPADETLFPNDSNCRRFNQLSRAFAQRTADRCEHCLDFRQTYGVKNYVVLSLRLIGNDTKEMDYLNTLISKWMPPGSQRVAVDSHPRLSGIMDTINSTLAHGSETRLPSEFYDDKGRSIIDQIGVEEWFSGYKESQEYRTVGIGSLVADVVSRMTGNVERNGNDGLLEVGGETGELGKGRGGEKEIKFTLNGCHDTTLAAVLTSLGAFEGEKWPPYTSHIAFELFRKTEWTSGKGAEGRTTLDEGARGESGNRGKQGFWSTIFNPATKSINTAYATPSGIARKSISELSSKEKEKLDGFYVRVRYNDRPMTIPGCRLPGNHLEGDESFCTLMAFKSIVDKMTPKNWKLACGSNMDERSIPAVAEKPGY